MAKPRTMQDPIPVRFRGERALIDEVDRVADLLGWTRSAFLRRAAAGYASLAVEKIHNMSGDEAAISENLSLEVS